jgi:DNA-binding transcriptional ArsR family regulator
VPDIQLAIIEALAAGQARSLVELGVDLGVSYEHLGPAIVQLDRDGLVEAGDDQGQVVYRLAKRVMDEDHAVTIAALHSA